MSEISGASASPESETEVAETEVEPTEAEDQESEAESPPADEPEVEAKPEPDSNRVRERIDTLTGNWRETQRQLQAKDAELEELRRQVANPPKKEPVKTLADFDYDNDKYFAYREEQVIKQAETAAKQAAAKAIVETESQRHYAQFLDRETKFEASVKDYRTTVAPDKWACSTVMAQEIWESDIGPEMSYHLAKNPDIAMEIAQLPERVAVRRMALLGADLKANKPKPKTVSDAPPPVPKIKAGDAGLEKDPSTMTDKEFAKWREKQIAQR